MLDKPNVVLSLASSYNIRGNTAFTDTFTNGLDQRKINSIYRPVQNAITGKNTLYLCKRPGVAVSSDSFGDSGQVGYLVVLKPGYTSQANDQMWVFSVSGNDIRVSDSAGTTTIVTAAGYIPAHWDVTSISGTDTGILQIRNSSQAQRFFYASTRASWTEITDAEFAALTIRGRMENMDGYVFVLDSMNRIYNSDLNSISSWGASNYITKQIKQDDANTLAEFKSQLIAAGTSTFEVFVNAGNPTGSPLRSVKELSQDYGILRPAATGGNTAVLLGDFLYFVGRPGNAAFSIGLFAWNGSRVERVSTPSIEAIISQNPFSSSFRIFSVGTVFIYGQEAIYICFTPVSATTQTWLMFFPQWKEWFEWTSTVFSPVNNGSAFLGVGSNQHKIYNMLNISGNSFQDAGTDYTWTHQFQLPSDGNQRKFMPYLGLKGDTARSAQAITVEKSDDDYQTFQTLGTIDMTGKQKRLVRCGSYEGARVIRLSHSGNTEVRLSQFLARIT